MSGLGIVSTAFGITFITRYIVGIFRTYKTTKKFLVPNAKYFMNIFRGFSMLLNSFSGIIIPTPFIDRADSVYAKLAKEEIQLAIDYACDKMELAGITPDTYVSKGNDCDDHSFAKCFYARRYLLLTYPDRLKGFGNPIGLFGYIKDNGDEHQIIKSIGDNTVIYYSSYSHKSEPVELSQQEISSVTFDVM